MQVSNQVRPFLQSLKTAPLTSQRSVHLCHPIRHLRLLGNHLSPLLHRTNLQLSLLFRHLLFHLRPLTTQLSCASQSMSVQMDSTSTTPPSDALLVRLVCTMTDSFRLASSVLKTVLIWWIMVVRSALRGRRSVVIPTNVCDGCFIILYAISYHALIHY